MVKSTRNIAAISTIVAVLGFGGSMAHANLTVTFVSSALSGTGSDWTYDVSLDNKQNVDTRSFTNFVTVYDFGIPGTVTFNAATRTDLLLSQGWTGAFSLISPPADSTTPIDSGSILNFRLSAPGGALLDIGAPLGLDLGQFTLHSSYAYLTERTVSSDGQAFQTGRPVGVHGNIGTTVAPVPGPILGTGIPGIILACSGLVALARRRRRRKIS